MEIKYKRLSADVIDYYFFSEIIALIKSMEDVLSFKYSIIITTIIGIIFFILFMCKDSIFGYESIGKKIMKLKISAKDENIINKKFLIKRNLSNFLKYPVYPYYILFDYRTNFDEKYDISIIEKVKISNKF